MPLAMKVHNNLLRRQLRLIGGYEVKTEGDAFMVSFPTIAAALFWCFTVQVQLVREDWPLEILESEEGKEIYDSTGQLIARGLAVRMGIHWGKPVCELDPITKRMDYFGPVVNRASRVSGAAKGGQIMASADAINELKALRIIGGGEGEAIERSVEVEHLEGLQRMEPVVRQVGEISLKGLEVPETLSLVYPKELLGRHELTLPSEGERPADGSRVQFSVAQIKQLALLCVRLETLSSARVFKDISQLKSKPRMQRASVADLMSPEPTSESSAILYANPELLMPTIKPDASDNDLLLILDSLSYRIESALSSLYIRQLGGIDELVAALKTMHPSVLSRPFSPARMSIVAGDSSFLSFNLD
jgi:adenylate cyclase